MAWPGTHSRAAGFAASPCIAGSRVYGHSQQKVPGGPLVSRLSEWWVQDMTLHTGGVRAVSGALQMLQQTCEAMLLVCRFRERCSSFFQPPKRAHCSSRPAPSPTHLDSPTSASLALRPLVSSTLPLFVVKVG